MPKLRWKMVAPAGAAVIAAAFWFVSKPPKPPATAASLPHVAPAASSNGDDSRSVVQRLAAGDLPKLTSEQITRYVNSQNRCAISLITAWTLTADEAWLREAAEHFSDEPCVAIAMLTRRDSPKAVAWIERLKRADPGNAVGPLMAAKVALEAGDTDQALAELAAAQDVRRLDFHTKELRDGLAGALRSAGYPALDAECAAIGTCPLPVSEFSSLSQAIADAMTRAGNSGDRSTAERLGTLGMQSAKAVGLGGERDAIVTQLVSLSMERKLLDQLHVFDLVPGDRKLVADRLGEMDRSIEHIKKLIAQHARIANTITDSELRQFLRRMKFDGELKAIEWLVKLRQASSRQK